MSKRERLFVDENSSTIVANVIASKAAGAIVELIQETLLDIPAISINRFYEVIRKALPNPFGFMDAIQQKPFTDDEAKAFGRELMPYGEFKGKAVDQVPLDRLCWYADQQFQRGLNRYLSSPRIKSELDSQE
jgi:hypothetical protein